MLQLRSCVSMVPIAELAGLGGHALSAPEQRGVALTRRWRCVHRVFCGPLAPAQQGTRQRLLKRVGRARPGVLTSRPRSNLPYVEAARACWPGSPSKLAGQYLSAHQPDYYQSLIIT
jgi:hypothetical protein